MSDPQPYYADPSIQTGRPDYVLLSGCMNNGGDFYIAAQAKALLNELRQDRSFLEYPRWEKLSDSQLDVINSSKALLLTGGPALRETIYPEVYRLVDDLSKIRVPIIFFGLGWKHYRGEWKDIVNFSFTGEADQLIQRIISSPTFSSVRDYQSLYALRGAGFNNLRMTGCPGLFNGTDADFSTDSSAKPFDDIKTFTITPGAGFCASDETLTQCESMIVHLRDTVPHAQATVAFHHSLDAECYEKAYGNLGPMYQGQQELANRLKSHGFEIVDLSGSAEPMLRHYEECDFHIGFRVHAHICMSRLRKPSVLIPEDSRGEALRDVLGGLVTNKVPKVKTLDNVHQVDGPTQQFVAFLKNIIRYELSSSSVRLQEPQQRIAALATVMRNFLQQLP